MKPTKMDLNNKRIIISKPTRIGDVTCCLPIVTVIKERYPNCHIIFLGQEYTRQLLEIYNGIDEFIDYKKLVDSEESETAKNLAKYKADIIIHTLPDVRLLKAAKKARIPIRIATASKIISWRTCNRLVLIKRSLWKLHESQFDMMFLKALGFKKHYSKNEIIQQRDYKPPKQDALCLALLHKNKFNLIIHPRGMTPVMLWPIDFFVQIIQIIPKSNCKIFITGSESDGLIISNLITHFSSEDVVDLCGKTSLNDLIQLISHADGLIAGSTGPLHLAANFGIHALGIYPPIQPRHPERWGPIGEKAETLCVQKKCDNCRNSSTCACLSLITPQQVLNTISKWFTGFGTNL